MSAIPDARSTPIHAEPSTTLAPPGVGPDVSPAPPGDSKPPLPESVVAASSAPGVNAARARTPTPTPPPASSLLFKAPSESNRGSPSRSPRRIETDPTDLQSHDDLKAGRGYKRIIVCCDGTWQDGISSTRAQYTNVLRLSRAVNYIDERFQPPIPQIVYYQSGVGTDPGILSRMFDGATGSTLVDKVEEAYAFIAHNYAPGDEIFLFGFSRGAYTARMIAMLIGEIGVLDRRDMDYFASIFVNFQALGKNPNKEDKVRLEKDLHRWRKPDAVGRKRADCDGDKFTVKCVGVWDTVGALGLPDELFLLKFGSKAHKLFGFVDRHLGGHVERAYQALALNEKRKDFNCTKFEQVDANAKRRGQILKQCWFTGAHTDVGGGYEDHDLADLSLTWMAAQVSDILSLDAEYLLHLIEPSAPWGEQQPHDSATGIFVLAWKSPRDLPVYPRDETTQETIHPSVLKQSSINPALCELIEKDPGIVCDLLPFERQVQAKWAVDLASEHVKAYEKKKTLSMENVPPELVAHEVVVTSKSWFSKTITRTFSQKKKGPKVNSEAKPEHKRRLSGNLWAPETKTANIGKEKENRR